METGPAETDLMGHGLLCGPIAMWVGDLKMPKEIYRAVHI